MDVFRIEGGIPLGGVVRVAGSKNAALPILAASILADAPVRLIGVPRLVDVDVLAQLLRDLGLDVQRQPSGDVDVATVSPGRVRATAALVRRMRASFCVLGPLLARRRRAIVPLPGGCNIGERPVDLHLQGLAALGADLRIQRGCIVGRSRGLVGAKVDMQGRRGPTVTGTANVLCAATLARGTTTIVGAAREPEIVDLGNFLQALGARIEGLGTATIRIEGVEQLGGARYSVIPDRIEAATLLTAAAITGGNATVEGARPEHLRAVCDVLEQSGAQLSTGSDSVSILGPLRPQPTSFAARPYPGVPTDLQSQLMALLTLATGRSFICDEVFPERYHHVAELARLGAFVRRHATGAFVQGVRALHGADVTASDLRASAALVAAGLAARGQTIVRDVYHLDRGYEQLELKLRALGASIDRVPAYTASRRRPARRRRLAAPPIEVAR